MPSAGPAFIWVLETEFASSTLCSKHFTNGAMSQEPVWYLLDQHSGGKGSSSCQSSISLRLFLLLLNCFFIFSSFLSGPLLLSSSLSPLSSLPVSLFLRSPAQTSSRCLLRIPLYQPPQRSRYLYLTWHGGGFLSHVCSLLKHFLAPLRKSHSDPAAKSPATPNIQRSV